MSQITGSQSSFTSITETLDGSPRGSQASSANIAKQDYAQNVRRLIKLVTELRALGAQDEIDLPRIVVIGNQSAGKSSLVEAISGIKVPRDAGTCTRCPMECRLAFSNFEWTCQVRLRWESDENGNPLVGGKGETNKEVNFGGPIHDKQELEKVLRRAQLAILNPSVRAEDFVNFDLTSLTRGEPPLNSTRQLQFSSNVVCLDISGPDVADLSFIDLPGIISNVANGEDRRNIDLVKNLVDTHIRGNSLILLTLTMRDDLENQSAAFLAKEADPDGLRTIGVLTKPDTLQPGEERAWMDVVEGRRHNLLHGYYVTKQPAMAELEENLDHQAAREREELFFNMTTPWRSAEPNLRARLGVPNLTAELSKLLSSLIQNLLPDLRQGARQSLSDLSLKLKGLPPPPSDQPTTELTNLVTMFASETLKVVEGQVHHEGLVQSCRAAYSQYKQKIKRTAPRFNGRKSTAPVPAKTPQVEPPKKRNGFASSPATVPPPAKRPRLDDESDSDSDDCGSDLEFVGGIPKYVDEVRAFMKKSITRELPYNVPFSAKAELGKKCFSQWPDLSAACFDTVRSKFEEAIYEVVDRVFSRNKYGGLLATIRAIVEAEIERLGQVTMARISERLDREYMPFTQNTHYFSASKEKYLAMYKVESQSYRKSLDFEDTAEVRAELARLGLKNGLEDLKRMLPDNNFEQEIQLMAEVRAYFRVAYKRIIDEIPMTIDHNFLWCFASDIKDVLEKDLGLHDEDAIERARGYLREDLKVTDHRKDLKQKFASMTVAHDKLRRFNM